MFRTTSIFVRLLAALLVIGILLAAGAATYRAGFSQGYLQGTLAAQDEASPEGPGTFYAPGYYYPGFFRPHFGFGFFPFFPLFGFLLFGLLVFWLVRAAFWPRRWGYPGRHWHGYPPHWGPPPEGGERQTGEPEKSSQSRPSAGETDNA